MISNSILQEYNRCFVAVHLDAIDHNLRQLQSQLNPGVKIMAVVKADAYGHGAVPLSRHIEKQVDYFAVAGLEEALELRQGGVEKDILVLAYTCPQCYRELLENNITAAIYNREDAQKLSDTALSMNTTARIHIAVDTGMGRIGLSPTEESADLVAWIGKLPGIVIEGLFSHYAAADQTDKTDALEQTALFDRFIAMLEKRNVTVPMRHICNSAGAMGLEKQYDMCRIGVALYGMYPSEEMRQTGMELQPAMEVVSRVIHVKTVEKGTPIGYGHSYIAPDKRKIATISIGYADGYNRCFTGVGYVLIDGKKAPVVGKVCMDQIMVDVTDIANVTVGDHAVILGCSGDLRITAEELGAMTNSFHYEVVCNFMPRVKRIYYIDGKMV